MNGIYGYCIAPAGHEPAAQLTGMDGAPVIARTVGDVVVWVSLIERPAPSPERATIHNQVVEAAITSQITPVPLRFGQWSIAAPVFDAAVAEKLPWYRERLEAFAGALEFGLRVISHKGADPARVVRTGTARTGVAYMSALRDRVVAERVAQAEVKRVSAAIEMQLGPQTRETRVTEARTAHGVIDVAHLVTRDRFEDYRARAEMLRGELQEMRLLVSGPWAPYTFAA